MHNTNHIKEITALLDKARVDKQLNNIITAIHKHINEALESVVPDELISYDIMILRDMLKLQQLKKHIREHSFDIINRFLLSCCSLKFHPFMSALMTNSLKY